MILKPVLTVLSLEYKGLLEMTNHGLALESLHSFPKLYSSGIKAPSSFISLKNFSFRVMTFGHTVGQCYGSIFLCIQVPSILKGRNSHKNVFHVYRAVVKADSPRLRKSILSVDFSIALFTFRQRRKNKLSFLFERGM